MPANAPFPLAFATVVKSGIEPKVFNEFARLGKALDVSNDGAQGESHHVTHPAEPDHRQQKGIIDDFLSDQTAPVAALHIGGL